MNKSTICKISSAIAVCCGVLCGIALAPLVLLCLFLLVALVCLLCCALIFMIGIFVWLFSAGQASIFPYGTALANFALGLFRFISPVADFSFTHMTPIVGWVALGAGLLGIIVSAVGISKTKKRLSGREVQDTPAMPAETNEKPTVFSTPIYEMQPIHANRKKTKMKKTDRSVCVTSLVVCILCSVLAVVALIAAPIVVTMFH